MLLRPTGEQLIVGINDTGDKHKAANISKNSQTGDQSVENLAQWKNLLDLYHLPRKILFSRHNSFQNWLIIYKPEYYIKISA